MSIFSLVNVDTTEEVEEPRDEKPEVKQPVEKEETIFSLVDEDTAPAIPEDEIPWYQSIPADLLKGLVEGTVAFGRAMGPTQLAQDRQDITPLLDEHIPSDDTFIGGGLRRAGRTAPLALTSPMAKPVAALQSLVSGFAGETAKFAGAGDTLQTVAEIVPFLFGGGAGSAEVAKKGSKVSQTLAETKLLPERIRNIFSKKAANSQEINEAVDFMVKQGMTAEEMAPLVQGETKKKLLSKLASRGETVQDRLRTSKDAIGEIMDSFKTGPHAEVVLAEPQSNKMINKLQDVLYNEMPAKVRNVIMEDFQQLVASPRDVKSIIKFYRDIGASFGKNRKQLNLLKEPLREGLATINPQLANDFNMTNKLFQKYIDISTRLKPSVASEILEMAVIPKVTFGLATGNIPLIGEAVGEHVARKVASEMLTNPKFMNISKKLINALNKNQISVANKIKEEYIRQLKDDYPEVAIELEKEKF